VKGKRRKSVPYNFVYDLSRLPKNLFRQLIEVAYEKRLHRLVTSHAKNMVQKFRLEEATGLNLTDAITLVEDLMEVQAANTLLRDSFEKTRKRALLLPHCSRKFMDQNCKSKFVKELPSYNCQNCSSDCLINRTTALAKAKGYDVYVIPGGSCVERILRRGRYEAVVGVACGMELKLSLETLKKLDIPGQGLFLTRNGCANTTFNIASLVTLLGDKP